MPSIQRLPAPVKRMPWTATQGDANFTGMNPPDIFTAQLEELFRRTRTSSMLALLPIVLMAWLHVGHVALPTVVMWAVAMLAVYAVRILLASAYLGRKSGNASPLWLDVEAMAAAASGAGWGATLFMLNTGQLDLLFTVKLAFLAAATAFTMNSMAAVHFVYLSFTLPVFGIVFGYILMEAPFLNEGGRIGVGASALLYLSLLLVLSRSVSRMLTETLKQRAEYQVMLEQLQTTLQNERLLREQVEQQTQQMQATHMRLHEFATHDTLTRVYNRKRISEVLTRELHLRRRYAIEVSVLVIDINAFTQINEQHGYARGDDVLIAVATLLAGELREIDYVGRLVGDKFCCILPRTSASEALECAERLRRCVEVFEPLAAEPALRLTVSIGAAGAEDGDDPERLLARADAALYEAKQAGHNCSRLRRDAPASVA